LRMRRWVMRCGRRIGKMMRGNGCRLSVTPRCGRRLRLSVSVSCEWLAASRGSQAEVLADQAFAEARLDAVEARREEANADFYGKPRPSMWRRELAAAKAEREAHEAELEATPASKAEVERKFDKLKTTIENTFGKRLLK
jgi:hypothetical protein